MKAVKSIDSTLAPLLRAGETIPTVVRDCAQRLLNLDVWHRFSRNGLALSCADAARKRHRLGHEGIPLWDELKSFYGEYMDTTNSRRLFLAHCRGDRELAFDKLAASLDARSAPKRLILDSTGAEYGTINPFTTPTTAVTQIFDYELRRPLGTPGTVMTNAGHLRWAIEFDPGELVMKLPDARWADITKGGIEVQDPRRWGVRDARTIGILTGNPSDSGLDLWESLNMHVRRLLGVNSLGDVSMPKVVMCSSPNIGISMEMDLREEALLKALVSGVDELCAAGAKILAHPAHTTHYFMPHLAAKAAEHGAHFLSMVDLTASKLRRLGICEVGLLGTRYVTDFRCKWSSYREAFADIKVHVASEAGWEKIHALGYEVQQRGATSVCFNWMRDLLRQEVPATCEYVVLAMTEFSPIARHLKTRGRHGKTLIDPVDIYGEALAKAYLGVKDDIDDFPLRTPVNGPIDERFRRQVM